MKILCNLLCTMLLATVPAAAQNTTDDKNKAIIETNDGSQELNTDEISVIRFNGGKVTVVQPSGETTFDRTLRSLSFQRPNPGTLRLTATTSIGTEGSGNRAQAIEDGKLKATWAEGDKVYVYADASTTTNIGTLMPKEADWGKETATLTGNIDATNLSDNQTLYFSTKDRATLDLSTQDGTVESLFYFTATGTVTIDNANASVPDLSFTRPIAIVKFTLKDKADGTSPVYAKSFTVNDGTNTYTVTPASATNVLYVGIPAIDGQTVTLTATDGLSSYTYERASVTFANNKYYAINVKMTNTTDYLTVPLTFEATADGNITFNNKASGAVTYTINGGSSQTIASNDYKHIGVNAGDKVCFYGDNAAYATSTSNFSRFSCSANCYIYGNVMSLVSSTDYANAKTLTEAYALYYLFDNNSHLVNHPSKTLELPATTLTANCYYGLFMNCTNLTKAPALPATTLANRCYNNMFNGCTSLTTAPALPATTLADSCYHAMFRDCKSLTTAPSSLPATTMVSYCCNRMFQGCTSLTTAPELPATTLANYCYNLMFAGCTNLTTPPSSLPATTLANSCCERMFQDCTSLTTAPALPAETLASYCYIRMFQGCTSLTTAPELPATTLADNCYYEMFRDCTSLTTAPDLPATTLVDRCYYGMFRGCTNLNSVTCLATDISASNCTTNWLLNVAATGTFYKAPSMTAWTENSVSGIPTGWTVLPVGALKGKFTINSGGGKVYFSQGNLQYQASTDTWRFAPNQYDMIGSDNANISDSYTGWIDLLGWGTGNNPTNSSTNSGDYSTFTDWGTNAISNGGNTANMWHTLTKDEWVYLFNTRSTTSGVRFAKAKVNDVCGIILLPDDWSTSYYTLYSTNTNSANYTSNVISLSDWTSSLEPNGAVFLPAGGSRGGTNVGGVGLWGDYWSSTPSNSNDAYYLYLYTDALNPASITGCFGGRSVRLVYEKPIFQGAGTEANPYLISSEADWNYLANKVNSGTSYAEKFFRQTVNIDVTTMVGNSSDSKPFSGTYDGDGKTLNLTLNTSESHTAPFRFIADATIKNVVTTGSVYSTSNHPSGLVGFTDGTCTIQNCRVGANVGGAQHSGGIVGHCYHANISIIGCVYSGTLTPASGQWTGGIIGWGGDDGGHTITISNCLFAGTLTGSTKFHPIGILQNQNNTKYLSNTYYTLAAQNTNDDASFVQGLTYKGKFARSITAGTDVTVANAGAATVYDISGITSYGTGILYGGVLYAGNGEAISLTLSHADAPSGYTFSQYTVSGGGTLANPTTNTPTLTMTDANQTINAQWSELITYTAPTLRTGLTFNGNQNNVSGSAQNLVNAGSVSHGTIYYSTNGGNSWSTTVPQGTNAGSYTVHYKVEPDAGYSGGVGSTSLGSTTIDKANGWCTLSSNSSSGWQAGIRAKTETITVTHHHGGTLTATSSNSAITVSVSGDEVTISRKALIVLTPVTITITSAATANYNAASATYTCNQ